MPGTENHISMAGIYGRARALEVVNASMDDYQESYELVPATLKILGVRREGLHRVGKRRTLPPGGGSIGGSASTSRSTASVA
jgi:hypothetical protein